MVFQTSAASDKSRCAALSSFKERGIGLLSAKVFSANTSTTELFGINRSRKDDFLENAESPPKSKRRKKQISVASITTWGDDLTSNASKKESLVAVEKGSHVAAVFEDKPRREVGIASIDLRSHEIILQQFIDTSTYSFTTSSLMLLDATKIIIPKLADSGPLRRILSDEYGGGENSGELSVIEEIGRRYFSDLQGEEIVNMNGGCVESGITISTKRCCLGALAALLKFTEFHHGVVFQIKGLKISYRCLNNFLAIECTSVDDLELIRDTRTGREKNSLLGLFSCASISGAKFLRRNILSPLVSQDEINARHDAVEFLLHNDDVSHTLQDHLKLFVDFDVIISRFAYKPVKTDQSFYRRIIQSALRLRDSLLALPSLYDTLKSAMDSKVDLLGDSLRQNMNPKIFERIIVSLDGLLEQDVLLGTSSASGGEHRLQLLQAIKAGKNSFLDAARQSFSFAVESVFNYVDQLKETYTQLDIKIDNSEARGYALSVLSKDDQALPPELVCRVKRANRTSCTTHHLQSANMKLKDIRAEIYSTTFSELLSVQRLIESHLQNLHMLSDCIATIDMLLAFAEYAALQQPCVRPVIKTTGDTHIRQGRHPLAERHHEEAFVPFDYHLTDNSKLQIITAPNGGGKSTYLKCFAVLSIMSQMGCFIPAEKADIRICDRLFTQFCPSDNLETSDSGFSLEMKCASNIINSMTNSSIVLIDELGRGTNHKDAVALCWGLCERILKTSGFTLFSTHFTELTQITTLYPNAVKNLHMECALLNERISPYFTAAVGVSNISKVRKITDDTGDYRLD